jgi:serine phosphatase RsbU (regulator of sigma subunit)
MVEAEFICLQSELKQDIRLEEIYGGFYDLYYSKKNYKKAVDYLHLYYAYRDSARDASHKNDIQEMELVYNDEQQKGQIAIAEKDRDLAQQESVIAKENEAHQAFLNKIFLIGTIIVLLLGAFVFIKYKESKKQQIIISAQAKQMQFQKELVEAKNKDIIDSMVYASSIQQAILTSKDYISKMFTEFFIFYRPRDIVSGDFYWAYETKGKRFIAVGDCTGHGVPGAMMSMLGNAFLNEIVIEREIHNPADVLDKLRSHVKKAMGSEKTKDGMDMSFCCLEGNKLTFAGANLPLYYISKGLFSELKGNKQPIGYQPTKELPFEQTTITLEAGDKIYLFSDGYADQFGGEKGKKYKYKTFRERLFHISSASFTQQQDIVNQEFENWKGDFEQLDDVCVVGLKV